MSCDIKNLKTMSEKDLKASLTKATEVLKARKVANDRKPFDITKHEFSDSRVSFECVKDEVITIETTYMQWGGDLQGFFEEELYIDYSKDDLIAMCKALGVTAGDLM